MSIQQYPKWVSTRTAIKVFLTFAFMLCLNSLLLAQPKITRVPVKGKVVDNTGKPLAGASVMIKGTNIGTTCTEAGTFELNVPAGKKLAISATGYTTKEISVTQDTKNVTVELIQTINQLDQVIVIGYGTQSRKDVTASIASISGDKVNEIPSVDISRALQGRIAGVEMTQTSSKPGTGMQIRIRGTRSLNAVNDPLVVLDGIPFGGYLNDISPSEIKSIDILKDASATAIYGSRGANGVIIVTTNKGTIGQKEKVTYSGYTGMKKVWGKYPMMNGPEYKALRAANNSAPGSSQHVNTSDENDSTSTDWQDLLYQTGYVINQDLSISGSTNKSSYSVGFTYYKDQAVIPLQYYERYSIRTALDQKIGNIFRIGLVTNNYYVKNHDMNISPSGALHVTPLINSHNADGTWKERGAIVTSGNQWLYSKHALNALGDKYIDLTRSYSSYNSIFAEVKIPGVEGLKYRINLGLNFHQDDYGSYTGTGVMSGSPTTASTANISNSKQVGYTVENILSYDRTFARKHRVSATALYSAEQSTYWHSESSATNIASDAFQFYNLQQVIADQGGTSTVGSGTNPYWQKGLESYMGRVMYTYDDKYNLSVSYRSDASSVLAPGHQWNAYPAVSAGWNMKSESFMKNVDVVDALKLRVGYGETSNQAIDPYKTLGSLSTLPYNYGSTGYAMGYYVSTLPNPKLGWEFSKTWNFGVDFTLLKNRLSGTVEYYTVQTRNVLLDVGLPPTSGVSSYKANIGATQNKGIELSLNGTILDNLNGWTWELGVNVYRNRNKLVRLYSGDPYDKGNLWFPGHPIDVVYDYKKVGLMTYADSTSGYMKAAYASSNVGMIKIAYNPNDTSVSNSIAKTGKPNRVWGTGSALDNDDRQIYDVQPDFEGGFNTRVAYKNFELSITGSFRSGGLLVSSLYSSAGYLNNLNTRSNNNVKVDYWLPTNKDADKFNTFAPRPGGASGSGDNPAYGSTLGYFSATYLKVRTITLGYNFSQKWLKSAGIERFRVYVTAENPFIFFSPYTNRSHMDCETNSHGTENTDTQAASYRVLSIGTNTPTTRNFLFGLNVTF